MASVTKRGDKYLCQVRVMKHGAQVFSESRTFDVEDDARRWGRKLEAEVKARGPGPVAARSITVGELIRAHLKYQRQFKELGRSTIHNHEQTAAAFDDVKVGELSVKRIIDWAARRRAEGAGPATILANLSPLSAAFHAAKHAHGIHADPEPVDIALARLRDAGAAAPSRMLQRVASPAEQAALLEEFARHDRHHQSVIDMALCFRLAIALPRRASELTRMRWADLHREQRTILIRKVKHPRKKETNDQVVPLLGDAWELIAKAPVLGELILPYSADSMCAAFERARNRIAETGMPSIRDLRFHDLRRTGATNLLRMGMSIPDVCKITGHTNWAQLQRYCGLQAEDVHSRFEQLR